MVKEKKLAAAGLDELNEITAFISLEGWEYTRRGNNNSLSQLEIAIFDGVLTLSSDGTWSYKE